MKRQSRNYVAYRKVYSWLAKYIVLLFICGMFGLCTLFFYAYSRPIRNTNFQNPLRNVKTQGIPVKIHRGFAGKKYVHIDLKGAPPKISYYEYIFPLFSNVSIDGVVMEYEDMFPYDGKLRNISAFNSYSKSDVKFINNLAKKYNLDVIPLVQTFGHMEFVLKLKEFKELREVAGFPQVLCPSKRASVEVLHEMLSQIIEAHPDSTKIHIGADETRYIGRCRQCVTKMRKLKVPKEALYIEHIEQVREIIKKLRRNLTVLLWDDQLRDMSQTEMRDFSGNDNVIPVIWSYEKNVFDKFDTDVFQTYSSIFKRVWIASAFKGGAGVDQFVVDVAPYMENHRSWLSLVKSYEYSMNFSAIILTGWQRYDHFSILCELLPVALPSLVLNLKILNAEYHRMGAPRAVAEIFKCAQPYALMGLSFGTPRCAYPGGEVLESVYRLHQLKHDFEVLQSKSVVRGWFGEFNTYVNVFSLDHTLEIATQIGHLMQEVDEIEIEISKALLEIYDVYTKNEWVDTFVGPLKKRIEKMFNDTQKGLESEVWPRRPFNKKG